MVRTFDHIGGVHVVRTHAHLDSLHEQFAHHFHAVVHALQTHRLKAHHDAGLLQHLDALAQQRRNFLGVVDVDVDHLHTVLFQHRTELGRDAGGQLHHHARAHAQEAHMRCALADAAQNFVQTLVGEGQRVAAGEQHIFDILVVGDVVDRAFDLILVHRALGLGHHALAGAKAAQRGARVGDQKQHPARITMHDAGAVNGVTLFAELVEHGGKAGLGFFMERRQVLQTDGAIRVIAVHQLGHVRRDGDGKLLIHRLVDVFDVVEHSVQLRVVGVAPRKLFLPRLTLGIIGLQFPAREQFASIERYDGLQHFVVSRIGNVEWFERCML